VPLVNRHVDRAGDTRCRHLPTSASDSFLSRREEPTRPQRERRPGKDVAADGERRPILVRRLNEEGSRPWTVSTPLRSMA